MGLLHSSTALSNMGNGVLATWLPPVRRQEIEIILAAGYGVGTKDARMGCAVATVIPIVLDTVSSEKQICN